MANSTLSPRETFLARVFNTRLRQTLAPVDLTPLQITTMYGLFGFSALYVSDVMLPQRIEDPAFLAQLQALEGGGEIVLTAGLIYVLTRQSRGAITRRTDRLEALEAERNVLHRVFRHNRPARSQHHLGIQ